MLRVSLSLISVSLALAATSAASSADKPTPHQILSQALEAYRANDCAKAVSLASPLIDGSAVPSGAERSDAYDIAISCEVRSNDLVKAAAYARRATALEDSSDFAWRILLVTDLQAKRHGAALDTLERMTQGRGAALNSVPPAWLWQLHATLDRGHDEANDTRLLKIMADNAYQPDDLSSQIERGGDMARTLLARKLLAAGKRDEAAALITDLHGFAPISEVAVDPALRELWGRTVDFRAVAEADLATHRALMTQHPRSLAALNATAMDLFRLGRNDESIVMLRAAMPRIDSDGAFDDRADNLPWFWNSLAYAYRATGKYDDMVASFTKGAQLPERGGTPNVSQVINLALEQGGFGRPKDALATLERLGDKPNVSPYGLMQVHLARGFAYAQLGDMEKARADLAYAVAHRDDDPDVVTDLEIYVGDEEGAATSYISRLADPRLRRHALLKLADYDALDPRAPVDPFRATFERVRKRADVQAALRAAGGPLVIHLQRELS